MTSIEFISLSRPRSHSMPAFHPDQRTPALKQTHRRRSAYQSLTSISPLDFLHLHREKFQSTRVHKNPENGNPASSRVPPRTSTRLGFSIRRRRENANRPIIHQAKMVIREDEHVDVAAADGLPPYEESKARCSKPNDADDPISPTTIVPTITITPSPGHDDTANSPSSSTGPAVKVESKSTLTNESEEQPATEPTKPPGKPLSMPFYSGGGGCHSCEDRMIQPDDMNWHYSRTRSPHSFNNFLHPTHCPRLSGQCCKCGARGRCRHFNAAWSMPQAFTSGTMRSGRYRHNHGGDIMDVGAGHASSSFGDWAGMERYTYCPCGRGCRCECVVKILSSAAPMIAPGVRERMTRRHVEVHNTNTDVNIGCQHGEHHHHNCSVNHGGRMRRSWFGGRDGGHCGCEGGGGCYEGDCMREARQECVEIRRNGERLRICQCSGSGRYGRRRGNGRDMEVSCVVC